MVGTSLKSLLETQPDFQVVGEAGNGIEALAKIAPDGVVMDISMPLMAGLEATKKLVTLHPDCLVLALTVHEDKLNLHSTANLVKFAIRTGLVKAG